MTALEKQGAAAKAASMKLMVSGTSAKDKALEAIACALLDHKKDILEANAIDMAKAKENNMRQAMMDRLLLDEKRIDGIADSVRQVVALADPIGTYDKMSSRPNGLVIGRKKVPLGVIAIIFESRPNVTVDAAVLCLKAGNAVILRGGKEAFHSNNALTNIMREAIKASGPAGGFRLSRAGYDARKRHGTVTAERLYRPADPQRGRRTDSACRPKREGTCRRNGRRQLPYLCRINSGAENGCGYYI